VFNERPPPVKGMAWPPAGSGDSLLPAGFV
jgi:hypothetical protein